MSLLSVAEAQARILALAPVLATEMVPLAAAAGRWAIEPIEANRTQPAADLSAMDGYAIRFGELPGPWTLAEGESTPGTAAATPLKPGQALRIFTGAPLPPEADTILVQEDAAREGERLRLSGDGPPRRHAHVRPLGSDFRSGDRLIEAGERLTPARIGLAAVGGHGVLQVRRRPRIALISTGDELVPPGTPTHGVQLPSSNAPMLAALLAALPVEIEDLGIVRDDLDAIATAFAGARADIIVTTGGASVGDHDLVRPALERAGASLDFWRAAMKPGKPIMGGRLGDATVLGLPGNPVSAFVTATLFLLPLIRSALGAAAPIPAPRLVPLGGTVAATDKRAEYLRARIADGRAFPLSGQDSAALAMLAEAQALIVRPPYAPARDEGETVEILDIA
ncbi:molybdopterin molybdotransferase MoeA [Flavisphingomonas formosensis]|uniref:molybdopterin molybdotransferase MoeA n=1 Tax=Flavisphingomonas formosensis TaxID=861534 RepID=UPI0012FCD791|nr:molybdopterin molybdotransferase MoeA [Sphingomonas formosensis]